MSDQHDEARFKRNAEMVQAMNLTGIKILGFVISPKGEMFNVTPQDMVDIAQAGARIAARWARLAGMDEAEFMTKSREVWVTQGAEDEGNVRMVVTSLQKPGDA
jgi:hypothetical protein